ncbi:hypothetical protein HDU85_003014 [Gaertneriomyces sp. JEL0708]|nr:hypothetical protein HDU85_003014 [Gaertneriomyces sp. JEL0708]
MDKHFCLRHRPTADGDDTVTSALKASTALQSMSPTSPHYDTMSQILTLFSHLPNNHLRNGVLDGILDHCCLPQLSYLATRLGDVLRIDVVGNLPTEVALRVLMYLDAKSLCHAAQVGIIV